MTEKCEICSREGIPLEFHHLIPRTLHSNAWFQKRYDLDFMRNHGIRICSICHKHVHSLANEKELGRSFSSLEQILSDDRTKRFIPFAQKQKT